MITANRCEPRCDGKSKSIQSVAVALVSVVVMRWWKQCSAGCWARSSVSNSSLQPATSHVDHHIRKQSSNIITIPTPTSTPTPSPNVKHPLSSKGTYCWKRLVTVLDGNCQSSHQVGGCRECGCSPITWRRQSKELWPPERVGLGSAVDWSFRVWQVDQGFKESFLNG